MSAAHERVLDVSGLEPPEPLEQTLAAAQALAPGEYLRMLHRRDPCLLPANLEARGFAWHQQAGRRTAVEVLIWRRDDAQAAAAAAACIRGGAGPDRSAGDALPIGRQRG